MGYLSRVVVAVLVAFLIGAGARWFEIPVPAPPKLLGAILILSITLGYVVTDSMIDSGQSVEKNPKSEQETSRNTSD